MTLTELATLKHGPCTADPSAKTATQVLRESGLFSVEEMQAFEARERFGLEKYGASVRDGWDGAEVAALQEVMDLAVYCAVSPRLKHLLSYLECIMDDIQQAIEDKQQTAQEMAESLTMLAPCRGA
jgi:hypothetical protein